MIRRLLPVIALVLLCACSAMAPRPAVAQDTDTFAQLDLFAQVFERVREQYVSEVSDEELVEAAINGMLSSLDPHSSYLDPEMFTDMRIQTSGEFGGLGIEVTMQNGVVLVVSPIDDTPAFRAGMETGDLITHINGEEILGLTLNEAVDMLRGPVGSNVTITVVREDEPEPFDVTITREVITIQSVRSRLEGNGSVGYVRVTSFSGQATSGVEDAIERLLDEADGGLDGFVLDLRNNPGGLLDAAIGISDLFLDEGEIVSTRGRNEGDSTRDLATPGDVTGGLPVVVLINGGSASASEIVAGALQDHRRAIIMGETSFGKGSVQTIIGLSSGGAMRLTTALYYTPSGRSIQQRGIEPDVVVPKARLEAIQRGRQRTEAGLRDSIANPSGGTGEEDAPAESTEPGSTEEAVAAALAEEEMTDYQLLRAVDLIRSLALYRASQE